MGSPGYQQLCWLHLKQASYLGTEPPQPFPQPFMFNKRQHQQHGKSAAHPQCHSGADARAKTIHLALPPCRQERDKGKTPATSPSSDGLSISSVF